MYVCMYFSNTLVTEEQLQEFDRITVSCLRKIFNLNNNTTTRTMFLKKQHGGLGIRKPSTIYRATRINFLIKMLNHPDNTFDLSHEIHSALISRREEFREDMQINQRAAHLMDILLKAWLQ